MTESYVKEVRQTPVLARPEVLVAGGGFAGIAAALAAARLGKKVMLIERMFLLGGLGTSGLVTIYLPLCDGQGRQVSFGLAEELLRLSVREHCDGARGVENWLTHRPSDLATRAAGHRFEVNFNPQLFAISAEQTLLDAGVEILYGTVVTAVEREEDRIRTVYIETKGGRYAVLPEMIVDATGDADLAYMTGLETALYAPGNHLAAWYYYSGKEGYGLKPMGMVDQTEEEMARNPVSRLSTRSFRGLDGRELSEVTCLSHAAILNDVRRKKESDPTYEPVTVATIPQMRMTRRLVGAYTLDEGEVHKRQEDSVGMVSDWRKRGPVFEVPYGTLYSPACANLATAGRCTSVTDPMWDIMRVIPCCSVTGQAAGTAAALCRDYRQLPVSTLQNQLQMDGVVLHEDELV